MLLVPVCLFFFFVVSSREKMEYVADYTGVANILRVTLKDNEITV